MQAARIAGPAVGGLIFAWGGMKTSSLAVCGVLLIALFIAALIRIQILPPPQS